MQRKFDTARRAESALTLACVNASDVGHVRWYAFKQVARCSLLEKVLLRMVAGAHSILKLPNCQAAGGCAGKLIHALAQRALADMHDCHNIPLGLVEACASAHAPHALSRYHRKACLPAGVTFIANHNPALPPSLGGCVHSATGASPPWHGVDHKLCFSKAGPCFELGSAPTTPLWQQTPAAN